jgi:hypothetical protein
VGIEVNGYETDLTYYATRYRQGGRLVYSVDLSLDQVRNLVPKPDPATPTPGNRGIRPAHAQGFADYLREQAGWVAPAMILRSPASYGFTAIREVSGTEFGTVAIPRLSLDSLRILDGQHRILGIHLAAEGIAADEEKAQRRLDAARRQDPGGSTEHAAREDIGRLRAQSDRLARERISVQIFVESDQAEYQQMFVDIADNALGITASVKSRFDTRKVVNRALETVLDHPLLVDRVDLEADRIGRGSPFLLGAKHVSEIIRSVRVGLDGRVSRNQDKQWSDVEVARQATDFLDVLVQSFTALAAVHDGVITPDTLRKTSLLGSVLTLRVLAGAYHDLRFDHGQSDESIRGYFATLNEHMDGPATPDSLWAAHFGEGAMAPNGRRQELKAFKQEVVELGLRSPQFAATR